MEVQRPGSTSHALECYLSQDTGLWGRSRTMRSQTSPWHANREDLVKAVVRRALKEAGVLESGLRFEDFKRALHGSALQMEVDIPSED